MDRKDFTNFEKGIKDIIKSYVGCVNSKETREELGLKIYLYTHLYGLDDELKFAINPGDPNKQSPEIVGLNNFSKYFLTKISEEPCPEVDLPKAMNIASKTLGFDLESVHPKTMEQFYEERCNALEELLAERIGEDELISYGFSTEDGRETCSIIKRPLRIDMSKHKTLTDVDFKILMKHGLSADDILNEKYICGIADRDNDIFIIMTRDESWKNLCGREWHYNLKTKEFNLVRMN